MIHWLNTIGNNYGGLLAISGILLSIFLYLIPDISLPSWLKLLLVIVMLVSFHKLFVILKDFIFNFSKTPGGRRLRPLDVFHGAARGAWGRPGLTGFGRDAGVDGGRWVGPRLRCARWRRGSNRCSGRALESDG